MDVFFKDNSSALNISWEILISDLNKVRSYNPYCKSENYYEIFKQIIISMITGREIILLDSDFTDAELISLTGYTEFEEFEQPLKESDLAIIHKKVLIKKLTDTTDNWNVTLFTSGTTGTPKKVTHNFGSITRFVKYSAWNADDIWGFAYNPTHMAGVQVFMQALLNGNTMVRLFGLSPNEIRTQIISNSITHISATPTFYNLLLSCGETFPSIKRITSGGERLNSEMRNRLLEIFPNARITNVYASTEAGTLFASADDIFTIKPEYAHLIKFENKELFIHKSLTGNFDLNLNDWYPTGDLIEIIATNPLKFRFISRRGEMINVGGYKVNPFEVEENIRTIRGVKDVRVYSRPNSILGNIICCEIVCDIPLEEVSIRNYLQSKMQEFKIPRVIHFVNKLSTTRTGKIKRT